MTRLIPDGEIRIAINSHLAALTELLGRDPDSDDVRQIVENVADAIGAAPDVVRSVWVAQIAMRG